MRESIRKSTINRVVQFISLYIVHSTQNSNLSATIAEAMTAKAIEPPTYIAVLTLYLMVTVNNTCVSTRLTVVTK